MSLYKGTQKFDREQLVFVVESMLIGAFDRVQSGLPDGIDFNDRLECFTDISAIRSEAVDQAYAGLLTWYEKGGLEATGMSLGVLYAQLTGDGLGVYDALGCADNFHLACERLMKKAWENKGEAIQQAQKAIGIGVSYSLVDDLYEKVIPGYWVDTRKHAEAFVDAVFQDYLDPSDQDQKTVEVCVFNRKGKGEHRETVEFVSFEKLKQQVDNIVDELPFYKVVVELTPSWDATFEEKECLNNIENE